MIEFVTFLISGLAVGASFALVGSGFVVVHRVTHVVNFAQGSIAACAGMVAARLLTSGTPHGVGELLGVLIAGVVGLLVGLITLARTGIPLFVALLITLGLLFLFRAVLMMAFGQNPVPSTPLVSGLVTVFGAQVEWQRLLVIIATVLVFTVLAVFFDRTDLGRAMSATASNRRAATLVGINPQRMGLASFAIGGLLGGLAGILIAPSIQMSAYEDLPLAISGFSAAVFGGLSSVWRTLAGGLILGVGGAMLTGYLSGSYQTQLSLLLMLAIMIFRAKSLNRQEEAK